MPVTTIDGHEIHVDDEGFLTVYDEWDGALATSLAAAIGIELTDDSWGPIRFMRADFTSEGHIPTLRRVATVGGFDTKGLFALFPKKPAKKMAYIAGLPKPAGCV